MKKSRILVVEDERVVAMDIKEILESLGYEVVATLASGEEAVAQAVLLRPDLVLMDIQLESQLDGVQAADQIRTRLDLPIVYLTGNSDSPTIQRAKSSGPFGYVLKPFDQKDLETAIEIALYRHAAEEDVKEKQRWLSGILRGIGDAVIATDKDLTVTFMNPIAEALTGWSEVEARGRKVKEVFVVARADSGKTLPDPVEKAITEQTIVSSNGDSIVASRDLKETYVHFSVAPVRDEQDSICGAVLVFRDVTEQKRALDQLAEREEQLRQAQKLEAVGQLAGGIAHDFNNALTAILGYTQLLMREPDLKKSWREKLESIKSSGDRAASLTQQILAFSRKQALQPKVVDLSDLVRESLRLLGRALKEDVKIVTSLQLEPWKVKVDPSQIQQVIANLVINATDAMPGGGTLTIETRNVVLDEDYAQTHVDLTAGHYLMLAVSDSGHGIERTIQSRIFEPFFTTKHRAIHSGIGLATVFGIIKQSQGHILIDSEPGSGTTFKIYLPIMPDQVNTQHAAGVNPDLPPAPKTILLVEDEPAVRAIASEMLKLDGYNVQLAENGQQALRLCEQTNASSIDLLVSDVIMPEMNGPELVSRVLALKPTIKVLFMSGYTDDAIAHHGVIEEGLQFIHKPFSVEQFLGKVRQVLSTE